MSYGWKHLNFNTANPYQIGAIINDYLAVGDHETLKSMGLTQSIINDLESGTPFYDPSRLYGLGEPFDSITDYVSTGRINPPSDLNIPGDLWKWQFWTPDTVPEDIYRSGRATGKRTWYHERRRNEYNRNFNEGVANGSIKIVEGEKFTPYTMSDTFVHPSLLKFETAPSVNRLLSLWNAYGGDRSIILTSIMGFHNSGPSWLSIPGGQTSLGEFPELVDYPIIANIPFGQNGGNNFYYQWMMRNAYTGEYSGYNYGAMRNLWAEGRLRGNEAGIDIDPATGNHYTQNEINHGWGLSDKIQVPAYYRGFSSEYGTTNFGDLHWYIRASWDVVGRDILSFDSPYRGGDAFRWITGDSNISEIDVQLPSGIKVKEPAIGGGVPWLEWPQIWDGNTYRVGESPVNRLYVFGEREPFIEFCKEVHEHTKAMTEWFNDGCPCDWQDYGGYVDPVVQAEAEAAEKAAVSAATQYVPTSTTSSTPPLNPKFGDLWRDSNTGKTKTFVQTSPTTGTWADA